MTKLVTLKTYAKAARQNMAGTQTRPIGTAYRSEVVAPLTAAVCLVHGNPIYMGRGKLSPRVVSGGRCG